MIKATAKATAIANRPTRSNSCGFKCSGDMNCFWFCAVAVAIVEQDAQKILIASSSG
jgi:hypothetical protein